MQYAFLIVFKIFQNQMGNSKWRNPAWDLWKPLKLVFATLVSHLASGLVHVLTCFLINVFIEE